MLRIADKRKARHHTQKRGTNQQTTITVRQAEVRQHHLSSGKEAKKNRETGS